MRSVIGEFLFGLGIAIMSGSFVLLWQYLSEYFLELKYVYVGILVCLGIVLIFIEAVRINFYEKKDEKVSEKEFWNHLGGLLKTKKKRIIILDKSGQKETEFLKSQIISLKKDYLNNSWELSNKVFLAIFGLFFSIIIGLFSQFSNFVEKNLLPLFLVLLAISFILAIILFIGYSIIYNKKRREEYNKLLKEIKEGKINSVE